MTNCAEKLHHATKRGALDHLKWAKRQPGGHGIRYLDAYRCPCGGGWCVGRSWKTKRVMEAAQPKPEKTTAEKTPTAGEIRRKARREAVQAEKALRYRLRKVDALGSLADMADSFAIALRMAAAEISRMEKIRGF